MHLSSTSLEMTGLGAVLAPYQVPLDLRVADAYLSRYAPKCYLLWLYRTLFPAAYAASTVSRTREDQRYTNRYTPAELELFHLVDTSLFPIHDAGHYGSFRNGYFYSHLHTYAFDSQRPSYKRPGWVALWFCAGGIRLSQIGAWHELYTVLQIMPRRGIRYDLDLVQLAFAGRPYPQDAIPLAIQMIQRTTGNPWLDTPFNWAREIRWHPADLQTLATQWTAAQAILTHVTALLDWLEEQTAHIEEMIYAWIPCKQRRRATTR